MSIGFSPLGASALRADWLSVSRKGFETGLLWFAMAICGIVWIEPAPFDFVVLILIGFWLLSGLHFPKTFTIPLALIGVLAATGLLGALLSDTMISSGRHIVISIFLYVVTVGLGAYVARDPRTTLPIIMSGYTVAAVLATIAGIAGYFSLFDGAYDLFVERERARGSFKDPNVFGPFLVLPMVWGLMQHLTGKARAGGLQSGILALLGLGILLSFSRGAWANLVLASGVSVYLLFVSVKSNNMRLKVLGLTLCAGLLGAVLLLFALSFDAIADLMNVRGHLVQSYDTDERFLGARIALDVILTHPFGVGATGFERFHVAEPHNVYLYSFLIGGWVGGFAYLCLVVYTLVIGFRCTLKDGPLRMFAIVLFSVFLAVALEGVIVDTDHWRHFYILMACIWGLHGFLAQSDGVADAPVGTLKRIQKIPGLAARLHEVEQTSSPTPAREAVRPALGIAATSVNRYDIPHKPQCGATGGFGLPKPTGEVVRYKPRDVISRGRRALVARPFKLKTLREKYEHILPVAAPADSRSSFGLREANDAPGHATFGRRLLGSGIAPYVT